MTTKTVSHVPSQHLRFVIRDGKRILQQHWFPVDWDMHTPDGREIKSFWCDVALQEERAGDSEPFQSIPCAHLETLGSKGIDLHDFDNEIPDPED